MSAQQLPETDSIQELARFWDTHDLTDFQDELEEVTEPVFEPSRPIMLRLEINEAETVRRLADSKGIKDADLIREWVLERIHAT
ncbi:MAG: CopG family antitoxin [Planctomycetaceae bacterium]